MARLLIVCALLLANLPALAQLGPDGQVMPTWLRLVDRDGQVHDLDGFMVDTITLCPTRGSADIWLQDDAAGSAIIETADGVIRMQYGMRHYNEGGVTGNPDTTGDQLLLVEDAAVMFSGGMEPCVRYGWSAEP